MESTLWDLDLAPTEAGRTRQPHHECPVEAALSAVSGKWTTLILRELMSGPRLYSALSASLPGLSDKVLSDRLRTFVESGLVRRTIVRSYPPRSEYELTKLGHALRPLLLELYSTGSALLRGASSPRVTSTTLRGQLR